jgi:hypothetical protein
VAVRPVVRDTEYVIRFTEIVFPRRSAMLLIPCRAHSSMQPVWVPAIATTGTPVSTAAASVLP